jgi:hypothetical protein
MLQPTPATLKPHLNTRAEPGATPEQNAWRSSAHAFSRLGRSSMCSASCCSRIISSRLQPSDSSRRCSRKHAWTRPSPAGQHIAVETDNVAACHWTGQRTSRHSAASDSSQRCSRKHACTRPSPAGQHIAAGTDNVAACHWTGQRTSRHSAASNTQARVHTTLACRTAHSSRGKQCCSTPLEVPPSHTELFCEDAAV